MADLFAGQDPVGAKARHVGAGEVRVGIVDHFVGVLEYRLAGTTQLAVTGQRWTDVPAGTVCSQLVAVVTVAAGPVLGKAVIVVFDSMTGRNSARLPCSGLFALPSSQANRSS